jgi:hypothetical protein
MRETAAAFVCALAAVASLGFAQTPTSGTDSEPVSSAVGAFIKSDLAEVSPASMAGRADAVAAVLGDSAEAAAVRELAEMLRGAGDWRALEDQHVDRLVDLLRKARRGTNADRLAPIVHVLERVASDRVEVQLCVAETYGGPSWIRNTGKAAAATGKVTTMIARHVKNRDAARILAFLGVGGRVIGGLVALADFLGFIAGDFENNATLRPLTADDLVAFRVLEQLAEARQYGDQVAAEKLLVEMRTLQPKNPVYPLLLAETYASWGPAWNADRAKKCVRDVIALTDPKVALPLADEAWLNPTDVRATLHILDWAGDARSVQDSRDLGRYAAKFAPTVKLPTEDRLVVSPDRTELESQISRLERAISKLREDLQEAKAELAERKQKAKAAKRDLDSLSRRSKGYEDQHSNLHARWATAVRQVEQAEVQMASRDKRLRATEARMATWTARFRRFRTR